MMAYVAASYTASGRALPPSQIDKDALLVHEHINSAGGQASAEETAISLRAALLSLDACDPDFIYDHSYLPYQLLPRPRLRDALIRVLGYWEAKAEAEAE